MSRNSWFFFFIIIIYYFYKYSSFISYAEGKPILLQEIYENFQVQLKI